MSNDVEATADAPGTAPGAGRRGSDRLAIGIGIFALAAVITLGLDVRPFADVGPRFIGKSDQADIAMVARNIVEGRGAVTDCVWLLHGGGPAGPEITHPEGYWSIHVAAWLAIFFFVFGSTLPALMFAAGLLRVAVAALGFAWARRLGGSALTSTAVGLILLVMPEMVRLVTGQSDMHLVACVMLAITGLTGALTRGRARDWALVGVATGLAIGCKPSGLLLLGLIPSVLAITRPVAGALRRCWALPLALIVALAPLAAHNWRASGSPWWPDLPVVASALRQMDAARGGASWEWNAETAHAWQSAAYDPTTTLTARADLGRETLVVAARNLKGFVLAFGRGQIVPAWTLPFVFCAFAGWALAWWRRRGRLRVPLTGAEPVEDARFVFTACAFALTCGATLLGAVVHAEARYFAFLVPLFVVLGVVEAARFSATLVAFALVFTLTFGGAESVLRLSPRALETGTVALIERAATVLPEDAVVMTQNPWEFAFHARRPSVIVPYHADPAVLLDVARRFDVDYLVVVAGDVRHEGLRALNEGRLFDGLTEVHRSEGLLIAAVDAEGAGEAEAP